MPRHRPYRQRPMNPHPGIWDEPATVPDYCYASPNGENNDGSRPTANYSLLTANSLTFTFSAKEKDTETGYSYFGSRYYSSDLSIWLSVDPMAAKYASLSPYVYCANNPVRCVDPNGEEIGQYLDWNGNFLGTDGKEDISVYFVSDEESINIITKNNEAQRVTSRSAVTVDWKTDIIEIEAIISVYDRTVINGGDREEATSFSGGLPKTYPTGTPDGEIEIDPKGYLSIHSHKLHSFSCPDGTGTCVQTPYRLSEKDKSVFSKYAYNVIVGNSYESIPNFTTGVKYEKRLGTAVVYDSNSNMIGGILIDNLKKIKIGF